MPSAVQLELQTPAAVELRYAQSKLINCALHQTAISFPKSHNELFLKFTKGQKKSNYRND